MKKSILNLGRALNKAQQKEINGGIKLPTLCNGYIGDTGQTCTTHSDCTVSAEDLPVCFRGCCNTIV